MKSKFAVLILVIAAASALVRPAGAARSTTPSLHRDQILNLVQNYVPSARLADIVKRRRIDFDTTEEYLATLRKAGAEPVLPDALRAARSTKSRAADDGIGPEAVMQQGAQTAPEPQQRVRHTEPAAC